jgi:hypothetical protein
LRPVELACRGRRIVPPPLTGAGFLESAFVPAAF